MMDLERIQTILKNSQAVIFYWRASEGWPVEYVSENISMFGYQADDLLSGHIAYSSIVHPKDLARVANEVATYTETGKDEFRQIYRLIDAQGRTRWIDDRTVVERDEEGKPAFYVGTIIDITEQKFAEEHNQLLSNIVNKSSDEVYVFDCNSLHFTYLNQAALNNIFYTFEEAKTLTPFDIKKDLDEDVFSANLAILLDDLDPSKTLTFETTLKRKNGTVYSVEAKIQAMEVDGRIQFVAVIRDITEHLALLAEKEQEHAFVQEVIDTVADSVMVINQDYSVQLANKAARKNLLHSSVVNPDKPKCYELLYQQDKPCEGIHKPCPLQSVQEKKKQASVIHYIEKAGKSQYFKVFAKPILDASGCVAGVVESIHDITALMVSQEKLKEEADALAFIATHDSLTGLPNRRLFSDRVEQAINRAKRLSAMVATVYIDVDRFKLINDSLGHQAGDEVLVEVAKRLQNVTRNSDTLARMGGDEFTLILEAFHSIDEIERILHKLQSQFKEPIKTLKGEVQLTLSIGAACYPRDGEDHKTLLHNADMALYDVKTHGRNDVRCYHQLTSST